MLCDFDAPPGVLPVLARAIFRRDFSSAKMPKPAKLLCCFYVMQIR